MSNQFQSQSIIPYTMSIYDPFQFSFSMSYVQKGFVLETLTVSEAVMGHNDTGIGHNDIEK